MRYIFDKLFTCYVLYIEVRRKTGNGVNMFILFYYLFNRNEIITNTTRYTW